MSRRCDDCGEVKPLAEFYAVGKRKLFGENNQRMHRCHSCENRRRQRIKKEAPPE